MASHNTRRLIVLLYGTAGLPFGIFSEAMPILMRSLHQPLEAIGWFSLLQLPWTLKPLWGPAIDRFGTMTRWLRISLQLLSVCYVALALTMRQTNLGLLFALLAASNFVAANLDIVIDGAYVRLVREGRLNEVVGGSLRITAYKTSMMLGSGLVIATAALYGWMWPLLLCALWFAAASWVLPPAFDVLPPLPQVPWLQWRQGLVRWFATRGASGAFAFIFLYKMALCSLSPVAKVFWLDAHVSVLQLGTLTGSLGLFGTTTGALVGSLLLRRMGLLPTLLLGSGAEAVVCLLYAAAATTPLPGMSQWLWSCLLLEAWTQGMTTFALVTLLTRLSEREHAATHFAFLTAGFSLARALGGTLGGLLAEHVGIAMFFRLAPLLCLPSIPLLYAVRRRLAATPAADAAGAELA